MKTNTKLFLGIFTAISVIGFIILWDLVIKESISSEEVVVLKPGVVLHEFDKVTGNDVIVEKRNRETLVEGYIKPEELQSVIGKEVNQTVIGNQIISKRAIDFENFNANPNKGESIRPIPDQWIYALPSTLRRKDNIDVYIVPSDEMKKAKLTSTGNLAASPQGMPSYIGISPEQEMELEKDSEKNEKLDEKSTEQPDEDTETPEVATSTTASGEKQEVLDYVAQRSNWLAEKGLTEVQWQELVGKGEIPVLVNIPVAYAKDGSGNEILSSVVDATKKETSERLTSTGAIVNLELILTEDHHRMLLSYINKGYQLYITYN